MFDSRKRRHRRSGEPRPGLAPAQPGRRRRFRSRTLLRSGLIALLALAVVPALPWLAVALFIDVDTVRPQIEAAVLRETGRKLSLGRVAMLASLPPTFGAEDVTFANVRGASRPEMLRIPYAEATLGIMPLLLGRLEITSLVLSQPDLVLETDPAGVGNWQFPPPQAEQLLQFDQVSSRPRWARRHAAQERVDVLLELLRIRNGRLRWRNNAGDWSSVDVKRLDAAAPGMDGPGLLTAQVLHADRMVNVTLNTGPLERLRDSAATAPWPFRLDLETKGAHARIAGTLTRPRDLHGYVLAAEGAADNLGDLNGLLHTHLPPLRNLLFKVNLADSGGVMPTISGVSLRASESDLDTWVPGLRVAAVNITADSFEQPVHAGFDGVFDQQPLHLAAMLGPPAALLSPGRLPGRLPVELNAAAAGGLLVVRGAVGAPEHGTGLDIDVSGRLPDLGKLSPLFGFPLPGFHNITLELHAGDAEGGFRQGLALRGVAIRSSEADLAGELDLPFGQQMPIRAVLNGRSLDIDTLRASLGGTAPPPPGPVPAATVGGWFIPADRLPLGVLGGTDLDLRATVDRLHLGGTQFSGVTAVVRRHDGRLTVDRLAAALPGGSIEMNGSLNAGGRAPALALALRAVGMPARPVFGALGLPDDVTGTMTLNASLRSAGASWHDLAGGLFGQAGLAMSDVAIDQRLLDLVFGPALRVAGLAWPPGAQIPARCATLRVEAKGGIATLRGMVLDTPSLLLQGDGALQLRDERIALRLRATPHGAGEHAVTVRIGGVFTGTTIYTDQSLPDASVQPASGPPPEVCAEAMAIARAATPALPQP